MTVSINRWKRGNGFVWALVLLAIAGCGGAGKAKNALDAAGCTVGQTICGGVCTNTQSDPGNCGGCGAICPQGKVCSTGACKTTCASPLSLCAGACVDLAADPANCGSCGTSCNSGQVCRDSACVSACTTRAGQTLLPVRSLNG